jgi:hypothetical protein
MIGRIGLEATLVLTDRPRSSPSRIPGLGVSQFDLRLSSLARFYLKHETLAPFFSSFSSLSGTLAISSVILY